MTAYMATMINAVLLILLSGWAYFSAQTSFTALIPAFFGVILLCLTPGLKSNRMFNLYLALFLTALIVVALMRPLGTTIQGGKILGMVRTGGMLLSSLVALVIDVRTVLHRRTNRER